MWLPGADSYIKLFMAQDLVNSGTTGLTLILSAWFMSDRMAMLQICSIKGCHLVGLRKHSFSVVVAAAAALWDNIPRDTDGALKTWG